MNIVRTATAIALLALLALAASAQEKDKTTGALKGKVRVERGSPAGVAVILRRGDEEVRRVETDRKGEFTIARVPPGMYGLTIRKPGLAVGSIETVEVKAGKTRSVSDGLILSVDEGSIAFLRGSVFTEGGRSVPGARVELSRVISETSVERLDARNTGETGEFVFRVPPDAAK
ncbi:MAG: carboxypeptidase-like regulatory domain-containing protein, partial [Pyrinomonadaceae bacterium]